MGSLGPLPPIDAAVVPPSSSGPSRTAAEQKELDEELDALHNALGVKRGAALAEAMKPELFVPLPEPQLAAHAASDVLTRLASN